MADFQIFEEYSSKLTNVTFFKKVPLVNCINIQNPPPILLPVGGVGRKLGNPDTARRYDLPGHLPEFLPVHEVQSFAFQTQIHQHGFDAGKCPSSGAPCARRRTTTVFSRTANCSFDFPVGFR